MTDLSRPALLAQLGHWRSILEDPDDVMPSKDVARRMIELHSALLGSHVDRENLMDTCRVLRRQLARVVSERDYALGRIRKPKRGRR